MKHVSPNSLLGFFAPGGLEILIILAIVAVFLIVVIGVVYAIVKTTSKPPDLVAPPGSSSREDRLKELESLRGESLISEEEFQERRQKVLDGL